MDIRTAVFELPWYDTHCHMACNEAVGMLDGAFLCDCVRGLELPRLDLWALLNSAFMKWMMHNIGEDLDAVAGRAGHRSSLEWARTEPEKWWAENWRRYRRMESTGISKALVRGVRELHGKDLRFEADMPILELNEQVSSVYEHKGFYGWWREVFERLNCVRGVKLVEMLYYDSPPRSDEAWKREQGLVVSALRVDTFTALHLPPERLSIRLRPERIGIGANCLKDYLSQVDAALDRAVAGGMRALKNAYAYFGSLQLPPPDDEAADRYVRFGDLQDYRSFEAAVLRHLLDWCSKRSLPYQMHAGASRIPWCNVENLVDQITTYPEVKFVALHVYPYVHEAGCLARMHHNVYLDPCWLSILAPETLRNALREWIGLVPPERILFDVDATTPEGWYGGAITAKEVLADVLE